MFSLNKPVSRQVGSLGTTREVSSSLTPVGSKDLERFTDELTNITAKRHLTLHGTLGKSYTINFLQK